MKVRIPQNNGAGNMQAMIKKMQEDMVAKQEELEAREYEVSCGGGVVTVKMNGKKEVVSVKLAEEIVDPDDIETLEDLVVAAMNEAIRKVETEASDEMGKITGGLGSLGIPGMGGLGGLF